MKKSKLMTVILLLITAFLIILSFYVAYLLADNSSTSSSPILSVKTKAQSKTYTRTIALNSANLYSTPTPFLSPTLFYISPTEVLSPTPTEIILVYTNPSPTVITGSVFENVDSSPSATKLTALPETGYISNALIIFFGATVLIFLAFIF